MFSNFCHITTNVTAIHLYSNINLMSSTWYLSVLPAKHQATTLPSGAQDKPNGRFIESMKDSFLIIIIKLQGKIKCGEV